MSDATLANVYLNLIPSMAGSQKTITAQVVPAAQKAGDTAGKKGGKRFGSSFKAGMAGFLTGAVVTRVIGGAVDFARESIESLGRIDTINTQTSTVIESTGGAAKVTAKHVESLAGSLENQTATEAESIQEGANLLLTFKNIQNEGGKTGGVFDQTVVAATDMARAMGTDVKSASMMLGKALNDPAKGLSKLSRAGVQFTDEQQDQIKAMQESGDMAGAQALMLGELNAQFGGSGAAYADTYAGKMDLIGNSMGNLGESIMTAAMPALGWLAENGAKAFNWLAENQTVLAVAAGVIGATLVGAFVAWTASIWASTAALLANPVTWIVVGVIALIAAIIALVVHWDEVVAFLSEVWSAAVEGVASGFEWLGDRIGEIWGAIADFFTGIWESITGTFSDGLTWIADTVSSVGQGISDAWSALWGGIRDFLKSVWDRHKEIVGSSVGWVRDKIASVVGNIKDTWGALWGAIRSFLSDTWSQIKTNVSNSVGWIRDKIAAVMGSIRDTWSSIWGAIKTAGSDAWTWIHDKAVSVFESMRDKVQNTFRRLRDGLALIWDKIKAVFAKPINVVIGFINKGIIGSYNWVAGKFGMSKLSEVAKLEGYAGGGWTGPGARTKLAGFVHGDEHVIKKKSRRRFEAAHPGVLDYINEHGELPGYAGGGRVTYQGKTFTAQFVAALKNAAALFGSGFHISQGGFRPRTSYSGTSHQGDAVDITSPVSNGLVAALRKSGIAAWDRTGKGNWAPHIHGVPLPGFGSPAGSAVWQAQDYLNGGDGLGGRDNGPRGNGIMSALKGLAEAIAAGFGSVKEWFAGILDKVNAQFEALASAGGGMLGVLVEGVGSKLKDSLTDWVKDKLGVGYASGTSSAARGLAWVGEQGPELVAFRGGERVFPASASTAALSAATGAVEQHITLNVPASAFADVETLLRFVRTLAARAHVTVGG